MAPCHGLVNLPESSSSRVVDADEEVYWNAALPKRYGALRDEDFPMFLTFDHVRVHELGIYL